MNQIAKLKGKLIGQQARYEVLQKKLATKNRINKYYIQQLDAKQREINQLQKEKRKLEAKLYTYENERD